MYSRINLIRFSKMSQPGRFDELFITVCKETGGIEGLLKAFFDFMARKTDFFY